MFTNWLMQGMVLIAKRPLFWLLYCALLYPLLAIGGFSQIIGIVLSVVCLFVGVSIAAACDDTSMVSDKPIHVTAAIRQSLPLAIIAGLALMLLWFAFKIISDLLGGQIGNILQFFWQPNFLNELTASHSWLRISGKLYAIAMVTLMFVILMLTTFGSWFSFPLMIFKNYRWSTAKQLGREASKKHSKTMSNLMFFLGFATVLALGLMPILTPEVYMVTSIVMYISYRQVFMATQR